MLISPKYDLKWWRSKWLEKIVVSNLVLCADSGGGRPIPMNETREWNPCEFYCVFKYLRHWICHHRIVLRLRQSNFQNKIPDDRSRATKVWMRWRDHPIKRGITACSRLSEMTPVGSCKSYFVWRKKQAIQSFLGMNNRTSCNCDNIPSTTTFSDFEPAASRCSIVFN